MKNSAGCIAPPTLIHFITLKTTPVIKTLASARGTRNFHPNAMSWSYRKRGNVPRTQMYRNKKKPTLRQNQKTGSQSCSCGGPKTGPCQPPRNTSVATQLTVTMFTYSARKNIANFMELYSV